MPCLAYCSVMASSIYDLMPPHPVIKDPVIFCCTRRPPRFALFPYTTLFRSRHDDGAMAFLQPAQEIIHLGDRAAEVDDLDRKSTRLNSSHANISYAVFCLKKKKNDFGSPTSHRHHRYRTDPLHTQRGNLRPS